MKIKKTKSSENTHVCESCNDTGVKEIKKDVSTYIHALSMLLEAMSDYAKTRTKTVSKI